MDNIVLIVLDSVRRDFFHKNMTSAPAELRKDFVDFKKCSSIYTSTFASHYTMFFGDYLNKAKNDSFPAQLKKFGFKNRSFCNGAIITGYPLKDIVEKNLKKNRPYRETMVDDLGLFPEFNWEREMFGKVFEDYHGAADDEQRNVPEKWKGYIRDNRKNKNFIFLHFWNAHHNYGINGHIEEKITGRNFHEIGKELIRRVKNNELTEKFVKDVYSKRINELLTIYIKDLIKILKETSLYQDSLIIITADHGEGLGDIGLIYNERFFYTYQKIFRNYCKIKKRLSFLPTFKELYYKWDFHTYYHNGSHDYQRMIPLLVKFPDNEFGGQYCDRKVSLFDIFNTIDELLPGRLDIQSRHGHSLYSRLKKPDEHIQEEELSYDPAEDEEIMKKRLRELGYLD